MLEKPGGGSAAWQVEMRKALLILRFARPQRMLSWALARPGLVNADTVAWLQVRDADLPVNLDAHLYLMHKLNEAGIGDAVGLMTSRDIAKHHQSIVHVDDVAASAMATLGLSNAETIGAAPVAVHRAGTINLVCHVNAPLGEGAMLEALSIAASARTAAVLAHGYERRPGAGPVIGTGTDCIVLACPFPDSAPGQPYAGLHTAAGQAVAQACHAAIDDAAQVWLAQYAGRK